MGETEDSESAMGFGGVCRCTPCRRQNFFFCAIFPSPCETANLCGARLCLITLKHENMKNSIYALMEIRFH